MNCNPVIKGNDAQDPAAELRDGNPVLEPVVLLPLDSQRVRERSNTSLLSEIWPFPEDFALEVVGELGLGHPAKVPSEDAPTITISFPYDPFHPNLEPTTDHMLLAVSAVSDPFAFIRFPHEAETPVAMILPRPLQPPCLPSCGR